MVTVIVLSVCLCVCYQVFSENTAFLYDAIRQWKEHLLFCKKYVWIVAKPFRFREKAVRRRFRSVFGQSPY